MKRLYCGAETKAGEGDISFLPRMVVAEKLNSGKEKPKKMQEDLYSLTVSSQLTQKKVEWVRGELIEKNSPTDSLRKASRGENVADGSKRGSQEKWKNAGGTSLVCENAFIALHEMCTIEYGSLPVWRYLRGGCGEVWRGAGRTGV